MSSASESESEILYQESNGDNDDFLKEIAVECTLCSSNFLSYKCGDK